MPTLSINGADIYYEILGEQHDQAVMALHGGPGIADLRGEQKGLSGLSDQYKLITYDHRGCGRSSETPPYTNDQYVEDAESIRKALGLGKIVLYGGSYGGFIAQLYALRYPENLSHLILRDTSPNNDFVDISKQNALNNMHKAPNVNEEMLDRMFDGKVRDNEDFKVLYESILPLYFVGDDEHEKREKQEVFYHYETHNVMFSNEFANYNITEKLKTIHTPTLVTVGKHDWITPPVAAKLIAENIPNSTLVQFEHSGHSPQLEESDLYVKTVKEFLNKGAT